MPAILSISLFCSVMLTLGAGVFAENSLPSNPIPLTRGTYWVYDARLQWNELEPLASGGTVMTHRVQQKSISWRMEVLQTYQQSDVLLATIEGYPSDLDDYTGGDFVRAKHAIIVVEGKKIYQLPFEAHTQLLEELISGVKSLEEWKMALAESASTFFELPLYEGKFFGDPGDFGRPGQGWIVQSESIVELSGIKGVAPITKQKVYKLLDSYNTSDEYVEIAPGVGIVHFEHDHHSGSLITKCDLRLIEYHAGK